LADRKTKAEMIGELFRELAVLALVFVPLEVPLAYRFTLGWPKTTILIGSTLIGCAVAETVGIIIERKRPM
jgi:hypothetical protein